MEIEKSVIESYNLYYYWIYFSEPEQDRLRKAPTWTYKIKEQWFHDRGVDNVTYLLDPVSFEPKIHLRSRGPVDIDDIMLEFKLRWL